MIRSKENWTWGIVNIPLIFGHNNRLGINPKTIIRKVAHNARCYNKPYYALDKSQRYLWFESDTLDQFFHFRLLSFYESLNIDVYWHRTMKGYHYITFYLMERYAYEALIDILKEQYKNGTFYYSLRIVPNKWIGEQDIWKIGAIVNNNSGHVKQLRYIQTALNQPYVFDYGRTENNCVKMLDNVFCLSRYEFKKHLLVKPT